MLKAATLSLAGQQEQMKEWESTCLPTQHSHNRGERNAGSWKLVLFSRSYWLALGSYYPLPIALCMSCLNI